MSELPSFRFLVEYFNMGRLYTAKFTNEKHAKRFVKDQKKDGISRISLFELNKTGQKGKQVK